MPSTPPTAAPDHSDDWGDFVSASASAIASAADTSNPRKHQSVEPTLLPLDHDPASEHTASPTPTPSSSSSSSAPSPYTSPSQQLPHHQPHHQQKHQQEHQQDQRRASAPSAPSLPPPSSSVFAHAPVTPSATFSSTSSSSSFASASSHPPSRPQPRSHPQQPHSLPPTAAAAAAAATAPAAAATSGQADGQPLQGFDTLDDVQRYALGALAVVLLQPHATDLNGIAFARAQTVTILDALQLSLGQHAALLALDPTPATRHQVVSDCVRLVGSLDARWRALQAMLALCVAAGVYDARSRAFLALVARHFAISWRAVAAVELAVAIELCPPPPASVAAAEAAAAAAGNETTAQLVELDQDQQLLQQQMQSVTNSSTNTATTTANTSSSSYAADYVADIIDLPPPSAAAQQHTTSITHSSEATSAAIVPAPTAIPASNSASNPAATSNVVVPPPLNSTTTTTTIIPAATTPNPDSLHELPLPELPASSPAKRDPNAPRALGEALTARRKKKMHTRKVIKIGGITLVGGVLFGLTGGLIAPALLSALAGVGVASAAGLAASGTFASSAVVGGLFGVAGGGFSLRKARHRHSTRLVEFDFERPDDQRVIDERARKAERRRRKLERLVAKRLEEEAMANNQQLAIESGEAQQHQQAMENTTTSSNDGELPRPSIPSDYDDDNSDLDDDDDDDDSRSSKSKGPFGRRRKNSSKSKKREKVVVGVRGLEAAAAVPSLHVCICVPAWLTDRGYGASLDQFESALKQELPCSQHIALRWESRRLFEMGLAFAKFWASKATVTTVQQAYPHAVAAASTVAGAVAFAFALPLTVMSCMDYIDNPWSILVSRSNAAGEELADVLVERSYGNRPVSLFGYSIGARVIFKCLESLASRGARGIVDNVFLMGAAVTADPERWQRIRSVVAGRIVNAYGTYDWALAFFHRGCGHGVYVSGLRRVDLDSVENLNMAYLGVEGHRELKDCVPRVMRAMGVGLGYITMPPARLLERRKRSNSRDAAGRADAGGKEEGGGGGGEGGFETDNERLGAVDDAALGSSNGGSNQGSLGAMRYDSFWDSDGGRAGGEGGGGGSSGELKIAPASAAGTYSESESGKTSEVESAGEMMAPDTREGKDEGGTWSKRNKSKSWLSWTSWGGGSSRSRSKSRPLSSPTGVSSSNMGKSKHGESAATSESDSVRMESVSDHRDHHQHQLMIASTGDRVGGDILEDNNNFEVLREEEVEQMDDAALGLEEIKIGEDKNDDETFDWEKQRKIWDEQERQMQERGYADSAFEIESRDKVVLNLGIEVAGRRLERFIEQDAALPVGRVERVYTNCLEVQRGMTIRVYEHEKGTKMVPSNPGRTTSTDGVHGIDDDGDGTYPKLLGELELQLREPAVKGLLRAAVAMHVDSAGDLHVVAEERFADGSDPGPRVALAVPRSELCTMSERIRLEVAERKRVEAKIQRELRNRNALPALPAPVAAAGAGNATAAAGGGGGASGDGAPVGEGSR